MIHAHHHHLQHYHLKPISAIEIVVAALPKPRPPRPDVAVIPPDDGRGSATPVVVAIAHPGE